jgi:hypothetical protein
MRKVGHGRYKCALCGATLDMTDHALARTMLVSPSGQPTVRVILIDGREIHRCQLATDQQA